MVASLADASRSLGELAGLARQLPNPHLLIQPFIKREAVISSRIEGTEASVDEVYAFEAAQRSLPGFRPQVSDRGAVREVANYVQAMETGLERLQTLPVSLRLIRELHEVLMLGVRGKHRAPGEFRRLQNWIGPEGCRIDEARYVPPPVPAMTEALHEFERYLHADDDQTSQLIRLALIHYQFEAIHPFLDGNGRIGRLLVSLLLVHWGLLPLPLLYLSAYFERNRERYYDLLLRVSRDGSWNDWVTFFLRGVHQQSLEAARLTTRLQSLQADWRERVVKPGSSALVPKLIDRLFEMPYLTIPIARNFLEVSYPTAKKHVQTLVTEGILEQVRGRSYPKIYLAGEIVRLAATAEGGAT